MKHLIIIFISCFLIFSPLVCQEIETSVVKNDSTQVENVSEEELFLRDIAEKAFEKDEKRDKLEKKLLIAAVTYLLIDKYLQKKK